MKYIALFALAATGWGQSLTPAWVEAAPSGLIVRQVVADGTSCPAITADGAAKTMTIRAGKPNGFPPVCEALLPMTARTARVGTQNMKLPPADPTRVILFGDTGCRIEGARVQACNDSSKWPFINVAQAISKENADLAVVVGDYLYREAECPEASKAVCGGSPHGDTWDAWKADFFTPAATMLGSTPLVIARGNHESCERNWKGWWYYLEVRPFPTTCDPASPAFTVTLGKLKLTVFDTAAASDKGGSAELTARYAANLKAMDANGAWFVSHHPVWSFRPGDPPVVFRSELNAAWDQVQPKGIALAVAGHTHTFQDLAFADGGPKQIVAGTGGTDLSAALPASFDGMEASGRKVSKSSGQTAYGYAVAERSGSDWRFTFKPLRQ